jgi:HAD superfamily hydrolase (TIGR01459 family)
MSRQGDAVWRDMLGACFFAAHLQIVAAVKQLSQTYPIWFCDIWGVVHDGYHPFANTCAALTLHREAGGVVVLVSNSPRSADGVEQQLAELKVPRAAWDAIVTSGDVTRTLVLERGGGRVFHLGPDRDLSLFDGLDVERVHVDEAKAVVCTGLFREFEEKPDDYLPQLREFKRRGLPFICANPDKVVRKGQHLIYCAGAIAALFEEIGGTVLMAGKPFAPIYELAIRRASEVAGRKITPAEILAIGDGPETDAKGAADQGYPVVLVTGGVSESAMALEAAVRRVAPEARILATVGELDWR